MLLSVFGLLRTAWAKSGDYWATNMGPKVERRKKFQRCRLKLELRWYMSVLIGLFSGFFLVHQTEIVNGLTENERLSKWMKLVPCLIFSSYLEKWLSDRS